MHDPETMICSVPPYSMQCWMQSRRWIPLCIANLTLFTLWHRDPCRDGSDDSCGWFKRARHGDEATLEKIIKAFEFDWDRTYKSDSTGFVYPCGYFYPNGFPHHSVISIGLNLFMIAAREYFGDWKPARKFCQRHLFDIMLFSENPTDSLFDSITMKFNHGTQTERERKERIRSMAACIYGWILRADTPWYRHPRWHVHHWRISIPLWHRFRRAFFDRCQVCGKGFKWGESVCGNWDGNAIWHQRCEQHPVDPQKN